MISTKPQQEMEFSITRTFQAPPERVFDAFTDPAKLARWWGPDGWATITKELDLRPGGLWRHTMRGPAGEEIPNEDRFVEVDRPRRLVIEHVLVPRHRKTITFEPAPSLAGTKMTFHMAFTDVEDLRIAMDVHGARKGLGQTVSRLADLVDGTGFTLEREFRAAPEKVWRMWTTPEGIERWWGASAREMGYQFRVLRMDVRPGGSFAFSMKNEQHDLVNHGTYTTVDAPRDLAWTWRFDLFDAASAPFDVNLRVRLAPTPSGGTRLVFTEGPLQAPEHTEGSRKGVEQNLRHLAAALDEA